MNALLKENSIARKQMLNRTGPYALARTQTKTPFFTDHMRVFAMIVGTAAIYAIGAAIVSVVIVEAIAGCGEVEYNMHNGTWQTLPCVIVPYTPVSGTW
tara:strand:- start:2566 stop:2862 length:297 start_codon:yes stop_codon:yes gene_type:complete